MDKTSTCVPNCDDPWQHGDPWPTSPAPVNDSGLVGLGKALVIVGVVGGVLGACCVGCCIYCCVASSRKSRSKSRRKMPLYEPPTGVALTHLPPEGESENRPGDYKAK